MSIITTATLITFVTILGLIFFLTNEKKDRVRVRNLLIKMYKDVENENMKHERQIKLTIATTSQDEQGLVRSIITVDETAGPIGIIRFTYDTTNENKSISGISNISISAENKQDEDFLHLILVENISVIKRELDKGCLN